MLFNAPEFLFGFLPATLVIVFAAAHFFGRKIGVSVLIAASLFFYAWWKVPYLAIVVGSVLLNLGLARLIERNRKHSGKARFILTAGITVNLLVLAYFKYANFLISTISGLTSLRFPALNIVLPIGLSFYTFQQISFLVDTATGRVGTITAREYAAAVLFFPHLIAGPLVNYRDIICQFRDQMQVSAATVFTGLPVFMVGLTKKVLVADNIAVVVSPLFARAVAGPLDFVAAWLAALGYTAQLYFDFSGYSDMAIGLGLMFGIVLPVNFFSPYKATSIIEFWRRWHITLSAFLRNYLYIPLGGGRSWPIRRYVNMMLVMLLGGLWHGAAWTFVAWGGLHGLYLLINHFWRNIFKYSPPAFLSAALTFLCVVWAWVLFRAPDFQSAMNVYAGMVGRAGLELPGMIAYLLNLNASWPGSRFTDTSFAALITNTIWIVGSLILAWSAPNTAEIFGLRRGSHDSVYLQRKPRFVIALATAALIWISLYSIIGAAPSEFLYFQF